MRAAPIPGPPAGWVGGAPRACASAGGPRAWRGGPRVCVGIRRRRGGGHLGRVSVCARPPRAAPAWCCIHTVSKRGKRRRDIPKWRISAPNPLTLADGVL